MQQGRTVRVEHTLGVARGSRGVAQGCRRALIELWPGEIRALFGQQLLVAQQVGDIQGRHQRPLAKGDPVLDVRAVRRDGLDQRGEAQVEADDAVLGVVHYPADLLRKKTGIDGMGNGPHTGDRVVQLEMAITIPRQGANSITGLNTELGQGIRGFLRTQVRVGIGVAVQGTFVRAGNDLGIAMIALGMFQQGRDDQRQRHHLTVHSVLAFYFLGY